MKEKLTNQQKQVLKFIDDFIKKAINCGIDPEKFTNVFMTGYCYYFSLILKSAFNRGTICICAPYGHVVWVDVDGTLYDADGIMERDDESLVPADAEDSHIIDFKHIQTNQPGITKEELNSLVEKYRDYDPNER